MRRPDSTAEEPIVLSRADITDFDLGAKFDLVIAPFRVIQNFATEVELQGLFDSIRRHLSPEGRGILDAFRPSRDPGGMVASWASEREELAWEVETCRDLRAMSTGDSVKVKIRWNVSDGWYVVTMGSTSNCGTGGDWAHVTRTIAADTTWVIQSVGPAKLCRVIDLPGKKNDDTFWLAADAIVDLTLQFSTN